MNEKILIIEDEKVIRENVSYLLTLSGFEVRVAANGQDGLNQAIEFKPDLILCDIMMPEMDGFQVIECIRKEKDLSMVPFIFLTAKGELSDMRRGMILGADDYLTKPFTLEELIETIEARLRRRIEIDHVIQNRIQNIYKKLSNTSSHEFNTSLNSIMGFAELLKDHYSSLDKEEVRSILEMIHTSSNHLKRNLDSITTYNEIQAITDSNDVKAELTSGITYFDEQFVKSIWNDVANYFMDQELYFELDIEKTELLINEMYLKKVLLELLDNAVRFASETPKVRLKGRNEGMNYIIEITDNGQGFSEEEIKEIKPFVQFRRQVLEQKGLGMGLYLARRLVQLSKGRFTIESTPGVSTKIEIKLFRYIAAWSNN